MVLLVYTLVASAAPVAARAANSAAISICPAPHAPVVIVHGGLLTANEQPREDAEIHLEGGLITWIGDTGGRARPRNSIVIDAKGKSVLPGLVDAHAHVSYLGQVSRAEDRSDRLNRIMPLAARQLLRSGVTTARDPYLDLKNGPAFKRRACPDDAPAPRLSTAGTAFSGKASSISSSGYTWEVGDERDIRMKLDTLREASAAWVKILEVDSIRQNILDFMVQQAHERGLKVAAHGLSIDEARRALIAGVDSIEHVDWSEASEYPPDVVALMQQARAHTFWAPTLSSYYRPLDTIQSPQLLDDPILGSLLPPDLWSDLLQKAKAVQLTGDHMKSQLARPTFARKFEQIAMMLGDNMLIGSEAGSENNFAIAAIWLEMAKWRELGVPPERILRAATLGPARMLASDHRIGRLAVGAHGDIVVLSVDFLTTAPRTSDVATVIKGGHIFVRDGSWIGGEPVR